MQRRSFPSILLYGFGLALALSLVFNGFLLGELSRLQGFDDFSSSGHTVVDDSLWQQQLTDCQRANQEKDSLIHRLVQVPNAPPPVRPVRRLK
ncbi:hypothetical protein [Siphonobacter aquaeclarae]|jgi:hypothetical protein|uniref:Uncharacterized protein n=1 Tax=Siphonobacter aquaeclarae TaxID=563176 RepID=A0A1G9I237_9BACT|nr:hypothetical protein [Siphonobacter aquaeclarae]MBO9638653.1 hypothetical protein [Siphonobacter aquaeclarae]SDL19142.1 hypothetical protein SAMN04488090_0301 [Siphonobacter aquaeclarae]